MESRAGSLGDYECFFLSGCGFGFGGDYSRALQADHAKDYNIAIKHYQRVMLRHPHSHRAMESARAAAQIAIYKLKHYHLALTFLKFLRAHATKNSQRIWAQRNIASIYYNELADYKQAATEYYRLLNLPMPQPDRYRYRFRVAKSDYFLNRFRQANAELDYLPLNRNRFKINDNFAFKALVLRANIFLGLKKIDKGIDTFKEVMDRFPKKSRTDDIALNLAVCYEEENKFRHSIRVLQSIRATYPSPQFIDARIKRLKERLAEMPKALRRKK